jgi:hypothetical protein
LREQKHLNRHPPDGSLGEGEVALFKDFGNANSSTWGLCTRAGDIGAPSAENTGLVVIQTHPSLGF